MADSQRNPWNRGKPFKENNPNSKENEEGRVPDPGDEVGGTAASAEPGADDGNVHQTSSHLDESPRTQTQTDAGGPGEEQGDETSGDTGEGSEDTSQTLEEQQGIASINEQPATEDSEGQVAADAGPEGQASSTMAEPGTSLNEDATGEQADETQPAEGETQPAGEEGNQEENADATPAGDAETTSVEGLPDEPWSRHSEADEWIDNSGYDRPEGWSEMSLQKKYDAAMELVV